ncbi:MAG: nitrile hydratase accessory protein [Cyanobacteria bacterium P01_E01_bin.6]
MSSSQSPSRKREILPPSTPSTQRFPVDSEPIFQAPWEAKAFAITNQLVSDQHWSWEEWTEALALEISAAESDGTDTSPYYEKWVNACQKLLMKKGLLNSDSIEKRIEELLDMS